VVIFLAFRKHANKELFQGHAHVKDQRSTKPRQKCLCKPSERRY